MNHMESMSSKPTATRATDNKSNNIRYWPKINSSTFSHVKSKTANEIPANMMYGSHACEISVCSWNILADQYCTPKSHPGVHSHYLLDSAFRHKLIEQTFQKLSIDYDVLCLQEVDMYHTFLESVMSGLGYEGIFCPRPGGRKDGCAIFYRSQMFDFVAQHRVDLNDLATATTTTELDNNNNNILNSNYNDASTTIKEENYMATGKKKKQNNTSYDGLSMTFLRNNVGLLGVLLHKESQKKILIASAHLYWNPTYEYVKLCQSKYLLDAIENFALLHSDSETDQVPVILGIDSNSRPALNVHKFMNEGIIDGRSVAPWQYWPESEDGWFPKSDDDGFPSEHNFVHQDDIEEKTNDLEKCASKASTSLNQQFSSLSVTSVSSNTNNFGPNKIDLPSRNGTWKNPPPASTKREYESLRVRYLLDFSLNKLCRWLRILGIDAVLETAEEEKERTKVKGSNVLIFDRSRKERRCLLTTSIKLLGRKDCPPGTFLIDPRDIEKSMTVLLLLHGVVLQPDNFMSICTVCNGAINEVNESDKREEIRNKMKTIVKNGIEYEPLSFYECDTCKQPYWWSDEPDSSAARVKNKCAELFKMALRAGVPFEGSLSIFDFIDTDSECKRGIERQEIKKHDLLSLKAIDWLRQKELRHGLSIRSSYESYEGNNMRSDLPFTNVTRDFVGTLDYIFYEPQKWYIKQHLFLPSTLKELNFTNTALGHILPNERWPSDHLPVGTTLVLIQEDLKETNHNRDGCECGCVPKNMFTFFEMAEMRKKYQSREKAKKGRRFAPP